MELKKAEELAKKLLQEHNPKYSFKWDNAKVRFGCCHYVTKYISLSKILTHMNNEEEVKNVILHEIAHSLTEGENHSRVWKEKAISIGYNGARCYNKSVKTPKGKYVYQCPVCKNKYYQHRKLIKKYVCKRCCEKYYNGKSSYDYEIVFLGVLKNEKNKN